MRIVNVINMIAAAALITGCATLQQEAPREEIQRIAPEPEKVVSAPKEFSFTDTPTLAMVPEGPVRGEVNGETFTVKTIILQPGYGGKWDIYLMEEKMEDPTDVMMEGQYFDLQLNKGPGAGVTMDHPMEFGDGFCQTRKIKNPDETTSWNSDNAWVLEITEWDVKDWDPDGDIFQVAGTASGKVAVCYKGSCGFADSWAAGTFTGAVIRYMGKPDWVK